MDRVLIVAAVLALVGVLAVVLRARSTPAAPARVEPEGVGLDGDGVGVVLFSSQYCLPCQRWEEALGEAGVPFRKVDVGERPQLARRYGIKRTPVVLALELPEGNALASFQDEPEPRDVERVRELATRD